MRQTTHAHMNCRQRRSITFGIAPLILQVGDRIDCTSLAWFVKQSFRFLRLVSCALVLAAGIGIFQMAAAQASCESNSDDSLRMLSPDQLEAFVRKSFSASDYECGIHAVEIRATAVLGLSGAEGVDGRFALRNLALGINQDAAFPSDKRLLLLKAAAASAAEPEGADSEENIKFDVVMFLKAADQIQEQPDNDGNLEVLALGIKLDQRLPNDKRVIKPWNVSVSFHHDPSKENKFLGQLLMLAQLTKGDEALAGIRGQLASYIHGSWIARSQEDTRAAILERAGQFLQLADALKDVKCYGCGQNWQWRPVIKAGIAYYQLGMTEEGSKQVRRAIQMARDIENPNDRLGQYRFVLTELLTSKFDRQTTLSLAREMLQMTKFMDSPIASEERDTIPGIIKRWGLESAP